MKSATNYEVQQGSCLYQYLAMATGTLSIISSGMHYGWPSPSLPKLLHKDSEIPTTDEEGSWIAVMPLIGAICGALFGGAILDLIGRKKAVLLTSVPFFIAWIMVAYAPSVLIFIIARLIAGFADGLSFCALPMYLGEIADPKIRGLLGCSCSVTWILGLLLINIIGWYFTISTAALISSAIPVLLLFTFVWMPESPYYLVMRGQFVEARKSLRIFKGMENVEAELHRLRNAVKTKSRVNFRKFFDLFTVSSNRKAVFIMMGLRGFQQLSGTTAITFYATTIFHNAGDDISPNQASIIYFTIQLILCSVSSIIVDRTGRRPLLIISIVGSALALFIEGLYFYFKNCTDVNTDGFTFVPIVALIGFVVIFSAGMQGIPILMLGELFPTDIKAFALCVADIYFSIVATIVSKFFQIMKDSFGMHVPFFAFAGCAVLGLVFVVFCVPETKGKTLEDIQCSLGRKAPNESETDEKLERFIQEF